MGRVRLTAEDLREYTRQEISYSILLHRESRSDNDENYSMPDGDPTDQELDDFFFNNPLLDPDIVEFVTEPGFIGYAARYISIRAEEYDEFREMFQVGLKTRRGLGLI